VRPHIVLRQKNKMSTIEWHPVYLYRM